MDPRQKFQAVFSRAPDSPIKRHVRYWPKADIGYCTAHVRFWGSSGHGVLPEFAFAGYEPPKFWMSKLFAGINHAHQYQSILLRKLRMSKLLVTAFDWRQARNGRWTKPR
jgi:hypothetical protein